MVEAAAFGTPSAVQGGGQVGCAGLLRQDEGEFIPVDLSERAGERAEARAGRFADAVEGWLLAGWNGHGDDGCEGREGGSCHTGSEASRNSNSGAKLSLALIGAAAAKRALAWDEGANAAATVEILRRAVASAAAAASSPSASGFIGRWPLPGVEEQARLRPLWRAGVLAFWVHADNGGGSSDAAEEQGEEGSVGGGWVTLQAAEAAPISEAAAATTKEAEITKEASSRACATKVAHTCTFPDPNPSTSRSCSSRRRRRLHPGTYVVLTAYNPMGTLRSSLDNVAAAGELAASCARLFPAPTATLPTLSVDPVVSGVRV